jgi:short-subunit dehydrogenase
LLIAFKLYGLYKLKDMKKYALVTGASGGIGYEIAKLLAKDSKNLVLVARSESKLHEVKDELLKINQNIDVKIIIADLSAIESAKLVKSQTDLIKGEIDILINNAGFGDFGKYWETSYDKETQMINLNITTLAQLTKLYLPEMIKNKSGKILNVASVAAFMPGSYMTVYYATKAFVLSYTEGLAGELKGTGVTVSALCPGPTKTGFEEKASLGNSDLFKAMPNATASSVAKLGYKGMLKGKQIIITGFMNKATVFIIRFIPRCIVRNMVKSIQKGSLK